MATFWRFKKLLIRFAIQYFLFVICLFVILVIFHFDFEDGTLVLNASVPGHCLPFTFQSLTQSWRKSLRFVSDAN